MSTCNSVDLQRIIISALLGSDLSAKHKSADESIYTRLRKYLTEPDTSLDPSPEINNILSELVALLQGAASKIELSNGARFADIERHVCDEIDRSESLGARADAIRSIAIRSETRLELFWARRLAKCTSVVDTSLSAIEKVRVGSGGFPYVENYVNMVQTEAEVIRAHMRESYFEDFLRIRNTRVAFCGSGPLPLTGILLSTCLGAHVTLIDNDEESVELSRKLVENWEDRGIIPLGTVDIICADGGQVRFYRETRNEGRQEGFKMKSIQCDVVFVAALIPNHVKEEIARNVSEMRQNGPLVVLRTAHGLTARFAYFQNRRNVIERYLSFGGLVVPELHEYDDGNIVDDDVKPIGFFPRDILNSLEIFEWKNPLVQI